MKFYKLDQGGMISVWKSREDGMEKCIYDSTNECYVHEFGYWYAPKDKRLDPISEINNAIEISEEDAVLEAI